jgi:hypothetical protein
MNHPRSTSARCSFGYWGSLHNNAAIVVTSGWLGQNEWWEKVKTVQKGGRQCSHRSAKPRKGRLHSRQGHASATVTNTLRPVSRHAEVRSMYWPYPSRKPAFCDRSHASHMAYCSGKLLIASPLVYTLYMPCSALAWHWSSRQTPQLPLKRLLRSDSAATSRPVLMDVHGIWQLALQCKLVTSQDLTSLVSSGSQHLGPLPKQMLFAANKCTSHQTCPRCEIFLLDIKPSCTTLPPSAVGQDRRCKS